MAILSSHLEKPQTFEENTYQEGKSEKCSICSHPLAEKEYKVLKPDCGIHLFHNSCLKKWYSEPQPKTNCPECTSISKIPAIRSAMHSLRKKRLGQIGASNTKPDVLKKQMSEHALIKFNVRHSTREKSAVDRYKPY